MIDTTTPTPTWRVVSRRAARAGAFALLCGCFSAQANGLVAEGHRVESDADGVMQLAAQGAGTFVPGWYVGLGAGGSDLDPDGASSGWSVDNSSDTGSRLFIGRHLTPRLRVELNYSDLGAADLVHSNPAINLAVPNAMVDYTSIGLNADWLLRPVNNTWNAYVRAGVASIDNDASDPAIQIDRDDDVNLAAGAGVQWRGTGRWMAQLTFERLASDAEWLGLSIGAYLGKRQAALGAAGAAVAVAAESADGGESPALVQAQERQPDYSCRIIRRVVQGVSFASASADLDVDSRAMLDRVGAALARIPDLLVEVVGHTDSFGDAGYNQQLSEQRALAVRDYLTGLPGFFTTLSARGAGEAEPVADNATAEGRALNRRIELVLDNRLVCQN
ncbi:MAG: OmpA family protein [Pseudomonadota bacterium]